jgi:error-prone DNA polymerase
MSYAELLCCSNFTFQRGASHARELVQRAKDVGYSAIAVTDECTLAGVVRAYEAATECGLKLIIGSQFRFPEGDRIALLAPTQTAYSELCELITRARRGAEKGSYRLTRDDFARGVSHCIALWVPSARLNESHAAWFASLHFDFRAFAFTHSLAQMSAERLAQLESLGAILTTPVIAVGDVHYHVRERRALHDVLTAIRFGTTVEQIGRAGFANGEHHLRPLATLRRLYPPHLLELTEAIAARCQFSLGELHYEYPEELVPRGKTPLQHLRDLTEEGARRRWPNGVPADIRLVIEKEFALIQQLKYEHYFLTVEEIVRFARSRGILCQGRGSAANSVVCYALGVTEVDPERVSMLFERFVSQERHDPPDIDIDFEHQRREEVIQHIYEKYGRHRAALAATVITYRRRLAVRDVGKALGFPPDVVDVLAKSLFWFGGNEELPEQLKLLGFDPTARMAQQLFALVSTLVGFPRHLSQHVGGFVISQHPLSQLVPVENAAMPERTIIQWDKNDIETLGLLKVDCLCLGMLSAIRRALDLKSRFDGKPFRMQDIPSEDPETYDMLCRAETTGVFQVESRAQMAMLPKLKPRNYFDLVVEIALIRPGPIQGGMVHPYLRRRQGLEPVKPPSNELEKALERTFGVPLFQEQVMQIAMIGAGFSAGEADQVRRSMGAWERRGGLEQFRDRLINGMIERHYTREFAESVYQQILGFGSYGFPMSHSASFALLAYASSWLRCHHHPAFVAGLLNSQPMGFYAPAQLVSDARRHGVVFRSVDIAQSDWDCTLEANSEGKPEVRLGFRLIAGFQEAEGLRIEAARRAQPFEDVESLAHRAALNRRALSLLARAGALSGLARHRRAAHWSAIGVERLPGALAGASAREPTLDLPPPSEAQELIADYQSLGLTLGRHPVALLRRKLRRLQVRRSDELTAVESGTPVRVAGVVTHRQRPETASGVVFMSLEDEAGVTNIIVWASVQQEQRQAVFGARMLIVQGELQSEMGVIHVVARKLRDYSHWLGSLPTHSRDFR